MTNVNYIQVSSEACRLPSVGKLLLYDEMVSFLDFCILSAILYEITVMVSGLAHIFACQNRTLAIVGQSSVFFKMKE